MRLQGGLGGDYSSDGNMAGVLVCNLLLPLSVTLINSFSVRVLLAPPLEPRWDGLEVEDGLARDDPGRGPGEPLQNGEF